MIRLLMAVHLSVVATVALAAADGPVLHYPCDEGQGDALTDASGAGNPGKISGPTWVKHGAGFALAFAGGDSQVDCGAGPALDLKQALTLSVCVKATEQQKREAGLVLKGTESYGLTLYTDGSVYFYVGSGGNYLKTPFPKDSGFHHVVGTCDGQTMRLYLDGVKLLEGPQKEPLKPGGNLFLGKGTAPGTSLQGELDEVRVYGRALSLAEVRQQYRALSESGLVDGPKLLPEPWASTAPFAAFKEFDTVTIPNGDKPIARDLTFPAVGRRPGSRVVLRFQSRLHGPSPGGWNWYLSLKLNDKLAYGYTANGTPRLVNRGPEITVDEGRVYGMPWWGTVAGCEMALLTFFGPGGDSLDTRIISDRQELYWHLVDITDLVNYREMGLDDQVLSDTPNRLTLINNLLYLFVKNREIDLVLDDLAVGYLPEKDWKERVGQYTTRVEPMKSPLARLQGPGFEARAGAGGEVQIVRGGQLYSLTSSFSHPGDPIGFNHLAAAPGKNQETSWRPSVKQSGPREITITGRGASYELQRHVSVDGDRLRVRDRFRNLAGEPVGLILQHALATPELLAECLLGGAPDLMADSRTENPTAFLRTQRGSLGVFLDDNVLRLQAGMTAAPNLVKIQTGHFALDRGAEYTSEWIVYPLAEGQDYWAFLNRLRRDLKVDYTLHGNWSFFHVQRHASLLRDPEALKAYLARKQLGIVAMVPWLDYDNMNLATGGLTTRAEYKDMMTEAARAFRAADPGIKLMGCIESFPAPLSLADSQTLVDRLPAGQPKSGWVQIKPELLEGLSSIQPAQLDCALRDREGRLLVEIYSRGAFNKPAVPMVAVVCYPALGNAHHRIVMAQARFLMEECGLDGLYIDCFSFAYDGSGSSLRYSYAGWDGHTCDLDPTTGRIVRRYVDGGLVGAAARAELIKYVLDRGGVFVANSYASAKDTQALAAFRFSESEYNFDPLQLGRGQKPPIFYRMTGSQLGSPIGLGYRPERLGQAGMDQYAQVMMKTAITYLRHGALTYHYQTEIPVNGPGAGEYGPFNHMFPLTPVELHEGYIIGQERTITAISGTYRRAQERRPQVLVFDITGKSVPPQAEMKQVPGGWDVSLEIEDWENVAVIQ